MTKKALNLTLSHILSTTELRFSIFGAYSQTKVPPIDYIKTFPGILFDTRNEEILKWCEENFGYNYILYYVRLIFKNPEDLLAFTLRWK